MTNKHDHEGHDHAGHDHAGHDHAHDHAHDSVPHTAVKPRQKNTTGIAAEGDTVSVHYTGTLENGETFDSSEGRDPIEFVLGAHMVIKGFEEAITGMKKGEKKSVKIAPKEAYGDQNPELRQEVPREALGDIKPEVGMMLALNHPMAPQPIPVKIAAVSDATVTIDMNHPLAGETLNFNLELVDLK
jgi:peptidylprolyl isomerase